MSRVIGSPETIWSSGPFAVTSGLNVVQCTPPSVVRCSTASRDRRLVGSCGVDLDRRLPHEAVPHLLGILAVALLRIDPVVLLLAGLDVVAAELALAVAVDDLAVRPRPDLAALAARRLHPRLRRVIEAPRERRHVRRRRACVLSCCGTVEAIRELLVGVDHVELGGRLVQLRRPAPAAVLRDVRAAVVGLDA